MIGAGGDRKAVCGMTDGLCPTGRHKNRSRKHMSLPSKHLVWKKHKGCSPRSQYLLLRLSNSWLERSAVRTMFLNGHGSLPPPLTVGGEGLCSAETNLWTSQQCNNINEAYVNVTMQNMTRVGDSITMVTSQQRKKQLSYTQSSCNLPCKAHKTNNYLFTSDYLPLPALYRHVLEETMLKHSHNSAVVQESS